MEWIYNNRSEVHRIDIHIQYYLLGPKLTYLVYIKITKTKKRGRELRFVESLII
jgi:hypothetical protein